MTDTNPALLPADPSAPPYRVACDTYEFCQVTGMWVPLYRRVITSGATSG